MNFRQMIDAIYYESDQEGNQLAVLKEEDYWYLKEQAERVGELESIIEASTYIQRMLRKQKRYYREILEEIKRDIQGNYTENELVNYPLLEVIVEQIDKTLEGEE